MKPFLLNRPSRSLAFVPLACAASVLVAAGPSPKSVTRIGLSPDQFVEARQAGMDMSATVLLALKAAVAAQREPKSQADAAGNLDRWAKLVPTYFPDGTGPGGVTAKTAAKPTLFTDRAGFRKAASDYQVATTELVERANANDEPGFKEQLSRVNEACTACHSLYKERDE